VRVCVCVRVRGGCENEDTMLCVRA